MSFGFNIWQTQRAQDQLKTQYVTSNTPTIFLHGWSSSLRSEKDMVSAAEVSGAASRRMIIHVRPNGKLKVTGTIKKWMVNPIILVRMDNNRAGEVQYAHWLTKVCKMFKNKYHVNQLNFVGHSMGAYAVIYYNLMNGNNKDVPRANKLCVIAGPYDGIMY
ncbi:alpha/beta hydrolase, partial [Lentilactobacillus parabuchneri]|uniref:alpha/beta hydrolase n=1 Tax=Lentilactobacillus parabuchneri TaxID=152331 RepID=UPI001EFC9F0E